MILVIRGHIRNSFNNKKILRLVESIVFRYPEIKIYIHTWNIFSNGISWRLIETNKNNVSEELILNYFSSIKKNIKKIIINKDEDMVLNGNLEGIIADSMAPIKGWKLYLAGITRILDLIKDSENNEDLVINTRFDLLECHDFSKFYKIPYIMLFIERNLTPHNDKSFFYMNIEERFLACDNIMIGKLENQHKLFTILNTKLDTLLEMPEFKSIRHQEFILHYINSILPNAEEFIENNS